MRKMRNIIGLMLLVLCVTSVTFVSGHRVAILVFIDGTEVHMHDANGSRVLPILQEGTTFVPLRAIGEAFGRSVEWDAVNQAAIIGVRPDVIPSYMGDNIRVFIDGSHIIPRDASGNIVHPIIERGTTFVPIRAIGEAFGKAVHWDDRNDSVFIGCGTFVITSAGQTHIATMADIIALNPIEIIARPRGEARQYTGVPLVEIFGRLGVDYSSASNVTFASADGFSSGITIDEALDVANTFIVIAQESEPLGTQAAGGRGPFMSVIAQDPFANRFVRYLVEITLQ